MLMIYARNNGHYLISLTIYGKRKIMQIEKRTNFDSTPEENHKEILQTTGLVIREIRLAYGLSQADFAIQQGIAKSSLQNAEYGRNITLLSFYKIIDGLFSPSEFYELMK